MREQLLPPNTHNLLNAILRGKKGFQCPQADSHDDTLTERKKDVCVKCGGPLTTKSSIRSNKGCPETLCVYECATCNIKWTSAVPGCRSGKHLPKPRTEQWTCFHRGHMKEIYLSAHTSYKCRESQNHGKDGIAELLSILSRLISI